MSNWSVLRDVAKLPFLLIALFFVIVPGVSAQEAAATGNVQGTVRDADGNGVSGARIFVRSKDTQTSTLTRSAKDGTYATEQLPPGSYIVRADAVDLHESISTATIQAGASVTADFRLEPINPEPYRVESRVTGDVVNSQPINGRNYLDTARSEPGVQVVDGAIVDPAKSGTLTLSLNSTYGHTTRYDLDEVEAMDETRGGVTTNLPADSVRELIVTRSIPEMFQSLAANGAVRVITRSGGDEWHGNLFGMYRDRRVGLAGFPSGDPNYSRQQYGFGVGGAVVKDKLFVFLSGERVKQDGLTPVYQGFPFNFLSTRDASLRENMLTGRVDYNWSENAKMFARVSYDNALYSGPSTSLSEFHNQVNVPSGVFGLDWNHGRFAHSGRFGYQKLVNAINPAFSNALAFVPQHLQLGSFETAPSLAGPRQTIQRDLFGRYDGSMPFRENHTLRFGGAVHRITQGDYYNPAIYGASISSSNGLDVINAINSDPNALPALIPGDPRGPADNPLNYPVASFTIYNGLGNFSEQSVFNRPNGGHFDTRAELYVSDTFKFRPNLNITVGVNYVRDTGRVNSDLAGVPILNQFGTVPQIGRKVDQPNWNFAPEAGIAWDPGHSGKTVLRAGGGMFFDNFLLQNAYQDRVSRLSSGQYFRSLTLCPSTTVLFPDGSKVDTIAANGVSIADICGQPIGGTVEGAAGPVRVWQAIGELQREFQAAQAALSGGQNIYALANSHANFGGLLAPNFKTPRVVHMNLGMEHQFGEHNTFSIDYVRQIGTQYPLGIDTNHVGDASHLDSNAALAAINATVVPAGCTAATSPGSSSQAAVNCYLQNVPSASITDFARHGLDSSNSYCGPFPCSALGLNNAAFSGVNSAFGSNVMYFPTGRSKYQSVQFGFRTSSSLPSRTVRHLDMAFSYTFAKYESNVAGADGRGGDYSLLSVAEDYNRPHVGHFGNSGLDRRNQFVIAPTLSMPRGLRLSMIAQFASPLSITARLPQQDGGGVAGEIFRTDATGDGTVGDILPGSKLGGAGGYSGSDLGTAIDFYNKNYAGQLTSAGVALTSTNGTIPALMTAQQLHALGALYPLLQALPGNDAASLWMKTVDLRLTWPIHVRDRFSIEPTFSAFNVFNFANFGGAGTTLSGILNGAPGSSLNNASSAGTCGGNAGLCTSRLDRILPGSGTYSLGAPRQMEFGVRVIF